MKRIVSRGILTLSLVVGLLAVTASTASADRFISPLSADFGNRQVGTTSPPQAFTLTVTCNLTPPPPPRFCTGPDTFSPSISVSGDFSQTNDCPPLMTGNNATGVSCTINVTFTPTSTGPKQSALCTKGQASETGCRVNILDPGPSATLTGTGVTFETPPTPPTPGPAGPGPLLTLDLTAKKQKLKKKIKFFATATVASTLVANGKKIKTTTEQLAANQETKVNAKLKRKARNRLEEKLEEKGKAKVKVEGTATTQGGATATDTVKVKLKD